MAGANRLQLDFKLTTNEERSQFLNEYLQQEQFIKRPPTEDELETMANYLLWGKDPATGLNAQQEGICNLNTKHGTWDKNSNVESLEGLMEMPTFNEAALSTLENVPIKVKKEVFSRKEALSKCPDHLRQTLLDLFRRIDEFDLIINFYELNHGRRKNPPRPELLAAFSVEEQSQLSERANKLNQYSYLKMRHQLVELRREQYTLRDSFSNQILVSPSAVVDSTNRNPQIGSDIEVLPLGLIKPNPVGPLIFRKWEETIPSNYTEEELKQISDFYWTKKAYKPGGNQTYIDFRELEHVYVLFCQFFELEDAAGYLDLESNLANLLETLKFYLDRAELSELHKEILDLKLKKVKNQDIADQVNKKWGKTYTPNYISTIFRQRIIPKINDAAAYHEKLVSNVFFEEEFKTCTGCGRTLLRDTDNFTRKARSKDGFTTRCKVCEKKTRNGIPLEEK